MKSPALYIHQISSKLPSDHLSNREFSFYIPEAFRPGDFHPDSAHAWIENRTGITRRSIASRENLGTRRAPIETEFNLVMEALSEFKITSKDWSELDALVVVKSTPNQYSPSLSQRLVKTFQEKFGKEISRETGVFTLDLFQPSTGILAALKLLETLPFRNAWIVTPEILTPYVNLKDAASAILFGDGAAILWCTRDPKKAWLQVLDVNFDSIPDYNEVLGFRDSNESFYMKGPELFRKIIPEFKKASEVILSRNHLRVEDISYYLPHQANSRIIERSAASIGFDHEQVISNIREVGNTANASMLIALDHFLKKNPDLHQGTKILMNACGAGLTRGAAILETIR